MTTEVLIAIISSLAGLIVAIIAWYQALRIARMQTQTRKETEAAKAAIEMMKLQTQQARIAFDAADKQAEPVRSALRQTWSVLQKLKHGLDLLRIPERTEEQRALNELSAATAALQDLYEHAGPDLPDAIRPAIHSAKNQAVTLQAGLLLRLKETPLSQPLPAATMDWLDAQRRFFSEIQTSVHAAREHVQDELLTRLTQYLGHHPAAGKITAKVE